MRLNKLWFGAQGVSSMIRILNLPALTPGASGGSSEDILASFFGLSYVS